MKKHLIYIALLLLLILSIQPAPSVFSQEQNKTRSEQIEELKNAIRNNLDTINSLIERRIVTIKKESATVKKKYEELKKNQPQILRDTFVVFIDTCSIDFNTDTITEMKKNRKNWLYKIFRKNSS